MESMGTRVNKYAASCHYCGATVPANGGRLWKSGRRWLVSHLDCDDNGEARVIEYRFSSGETAIQNVQGRCEDAPCCGCCTC